ncbi:MAG: hypothetical protein ACE5JL_10355 [Dehalococcoidia bacterium]
MNMRSKNTVLLALAVATVAAISMVGLALAADGSSATPTAVPRMVNDVDIPICEDLPDFNRTETTRTIPTELPILSRDGKPGNVRCGALATATKTPKPGPSSRGLSAPTVYRHLGAEVPNDEVIQVFGDIKVSNPSVPHNGGEDHHFVARFLAENQASNKWIEVGWGEFESAGNDQFVYHHSTDDNVTFRYESLDLTVGDPYSFDIAYTGGASGPKQWAAFVWWNGEWLCLVDGGTNCNQVVGFDYAAGAEEYGEVATTSGTGDFAVPDTAFGSSWRIGIQEGATLKDWTEANFPDTTDQIGNKGTYGVVWNNQWDDWYMHD